MRIVILFFSVITLMACSSKSDNSVFKRCYEYLDEKEKIILTIENTTPKARLTLHIFENGKETEPVRILGNLFIEEGLFRQATGDTYLFNEQEAKGTGELIKDIIYKRVECGTH